MREILEQFADEGKFKLYDGMIDNTSLGSVIVANQIGDGSSREQAASNQKILGGIANIAEEFATKRYRSNLINWGILPIRTENVSNVALGDYLLIENVLNFIDNPENKVSIKVLGKESLK